jgi:flavodoxin
MSSIGTNSTTIELIALVSTNPNNMNKEEELSTVVINGEVLGNTQYAARVIQENTGADIFRIELKTPYPTNHKEQEAISTKEKNQNSRPVIAAKVGNIEQYDTIFLGYPNWWADMPMIVYSFLEEYDLSGKTIVPFVTNGGSGFSDTINAISKQQHAPRITP